MNSDIISDFPVTFLPFSNVLKRAATDRERRSGANTWLKFLALFFLLLAGGMVAAQSQPGAAVTVAQPRSPGLETADDYVISPNDVVEVFLTDGPEFSREYRVSSSGQIAIPLLPQPIDAAGKTLGEVARAIDIEFKRAGLLNNPHASLSIKESRLHSIAVTGAVRNPQIYPVFGHTRLLDLLSQAGGLAENAGPAVKITRGGAKQLGQTQVKDLAALGSANPTNKAASVPQTILQTTTIKLRDLLSGSDASLNVDVYPGDWVTVPVADIIYVVGAVNKSGGFPLSSSRESMTVLQAIAYAEDLKGTARSDQVRILRPDTSAPNGRQEIVVNLKEILAGKRPDIPLQANDVLFVPDSSSKKAFRRGMEAAIQTLTGLALYRR